MSAEMYHHSSSVPSRTECPSSTWLRMWKEPDSRRVASDDIGEVSVSTVFLGIDHAYTGPPQFFETMVFGGTHDGWQWRYATWDGAEAGHRRVVDAVRAGTEP